MRSASTAYGAMNGVGSMIASAAMVSVFCDVCWPTTTSLRADVPPTRVCTV